MTTLLDIRVLVEEFYALEAINAMLITNQFNFEPMRHSHSEWYRDFTDFRNEFITHFASAIYDYTVLVVSAELRHCKLKASHYIKGYYTSRTDREFVFHDCTDFNANDILWMGMEMFDTSRVLWEENYGGENWRQIAKTGLLKGKVSDCVFIDHCVDLSHNNCSYFDKGGIFYLDNSDTYTQFLDTKRICDPQTLYKKTLGYIFNRLLWRASNLSITVGCDENSLFESYNDEQESLLLSYRPIEWGSERLDTSKILRNDPEYGCADRIRCFDRYEYQRCA